VKRNILLGCTKGFLSVFQIHGNRRATDKKYFHCLVQVRFVVGKVALGQIFIRVLQYFLLHTYFRLGVSLSRRTNLWSLGT